jgi:hypothetical protein
MIFRILEDQFAQKTRESKAADHRFMELDKGAPGLIRRSARSWSRMA